MKKFLIAIMTTIILLSLLLLGISLCSKDIIIETTEIFIKEEITNKIVDTASNNSSLEREEIQKKVTEVLEENPKIKEFISDYFDKFLDVINDELDVNDIDLATEVDNLIEEAKPLLNEYDIAITDDMKNEIMSFVSSDETNDLLNKTIEEIKNSIPEEVKTVVKGFSLLLSLKFRIILSVLTAGFLLIIAFMKKSYYKWFINLGIPAILIGIMFTGLVSIFNKIIEDKNITLNVSFMRTYGLVNLVIGILLIIAYIILNKVLVKKTEEATK